MFNSKALAAISISSLFLVFGLTGCTTYYVLPAQTTPLPQTQLTAASIPDNVITERVQAALGNSIAPASSIRVVTIDRRVCLYGVVGSYMQADEAARVTRTVDGVRAVDLYLTVVPAY
ncbi:MAG: BON domain-containing protein [Gammaproteobacteria bacterium]